MKSKNVVEINGKLFDAHTGAPISTQVASHKKTTHTQAKKTVKSIDGFSAPHHGSAKKTTPKTHQTTHSTPVRHATKNVGLKAKRSTTLNRRVVSVPTISSTPVAAPTAAVNTISSSALKRSNQQRLQRAQQIAKSDGISKFNHQKTAATANSAKLTETLEKSHPAESTTSKHQSTKEALVKKAVENATSHSNSHSETHGKKKKSHFARYASTAVAALLLAGYVAYLNVPSISMRFAAQRAGFAATMPSYKPSGYSLQGPIAYSPGQVTINFASNTDERRFSLSQQPTTWDSTALLENLVTKESKTYLTYQDRGLTIYIYDGSNAAWVNGGKLYQVNSEEASLDTNQLLKLATSV